MIVGTVLAVGDVQATSFCERWNGATSDGRIQSVLSRLNIAHFSSGDMGSRDQERPVGAREGDGGPGRSGRGQFAGGDTSPPHSRK